MSELVTLDRRHPDFLKYLWGTFSKTHRALPVKSLNIRTDLETVTFRVLPKEAVQKPNWLVVWLKAMRPRSFLQVLIPMFFVLVMAERQGQLTERSVMWLATVGVLLLFVSLLFTNDVQDHLSGADRIREDRGSRALQKGWLTAVTLRRASWLCLLVAIGCAIPLIVAVPAVLMWIVPAVLLGLLSFYRRQESYRDLSLGPLMLFLLGGPILVLGYQTAVTRGFDLQGLVFGVVWGWLLLFPLHLRDLSQLVVEGRSVKGRTWVAWLGFDRSVRLIQIWWFVSVVAVLIYQLLDQAPFWFWVFLFAAVVISARFLRSLSLLKSPAGSQVEMVRRQGEISFWLLVLVWVVDAFWSLGA